MTPKEIIDQRLQKLNGLIIRFYMLHTHYRSPINFQQKNMEKAKDLLIKWLGKAEKCDDKPPQEFIEALSDDLNTPKAFAIMHQYAKNDPRALYASMKLLGLTYDD